MAEWRNEVGSSQVFESMEEYRKKREYLTLIGFFTPNWNSDISCLKYALFIVSSVNIYD